MDALYLVKKVSKNNYKDGFLVLGLFYSDSRSVDSDYKEARKWFEKAFSLEESLRLPFILSFYITTEAVLKEIVQFHLGYLKNILEIRLVAMITTWYIYLLMDWIYRYGNDGTPQDYRKARECI